MAGAAEDVVSDDAEVTAGDVTIDDDWVVVEFAEVAGAAHSLEHPASENTTIAPTDIDVIADETIIDLAKRTHGLGVKDERLRAAP